MMNFKLFFKRIIVLVLFCVLFFLPIQHVQAAKKTVVVGYTYLNNFQEGAKPGANKSGYGYDYLQEVAEYAGWKYKYVYGDWSTVLNKLKKGQVDIMAGVAYSKDRTKYVSYPQMRMDTEDYFIFVNLDDSKQYTHRKDLKNKRIGVVKGTVSASDLKKWGGKKIPFTTKTYSTLPKMLQALKNKKVDAVVANDTRINIHSNLMPLYKVASANSYVVVSKKRPDILKQLNQAQSRISSSDPYVRINLAKKYYDTVSIRLLPSITEKNWVKKHPVIKVGYLEDRAPYIYDKGGEVQGTYVDFLRYLKNNYHLKVKYEYFAYKDYNDLVNALKNKEVDIAVPFNDAYAQNERDNVLQTTALAQSQMQMIMRKGAKFKKNTYLIVVKGSAITDTYAKANYPNHKILYVNSLTDAIEAVKENDVAFIIDGYAMQLNRFSFKDLKTRLLPKEAGYTFGVNSDNSPLMRLLNRAISGSNSYKISLSLMDHTEKNKKTTFAEFVDQHRWQWNIILIVVIVIIGALSTFFITKRREHRAVIWSINHDALTGLGSRNAYEKMIAENAKAYPPIDFCLGVFDADGLKEANDTLGHTAGDELLKGIAECLRRVYGADAINQTVYRTGGDEFMIAINASHEEFLEKQVEFRKVLDSWRGTNIKNLSVSAGYVEKREYPNATLADLIKYADERMYRAKYASRAPLIQKISYSKILKESASRDDRKMVSGVLATLLSKVDKFTGLPTISYFLEDSGKLHEEILARGDLPVIICFDINNFDKLDYQYGLKEGDEMLTLFGGVLARTFGKQNCSRLIKSRFFVHTSNVNLEARITEVFESMNFGKSRGLTARAGIAVYNPEDPKDMSTLCDYATIACDYDGIRNKSHYTYFDKQMIGE